MPGLFLKRVKVPLFGGHLHMRGGAQDRCIDMGFEFFEIGDEHVDQLAGLPEAARRILGRNARVGRPLGVAGLPEAAKGPAFSTPVGLLIYPQMASFESHAVKGISGLKMTGTGGKLHRMSQWLRDSF